MQEKPDNPSTFVNNSGEGVSAQMPPQARGLNWGAFFLNWIWGIGNNTFIALLCVIPVVGLVLAIVLLFKGNEWAWQNKKWSSVAQFHRSQKVWGAIGLLCVILPSIVIGIAGIFIFLSVCSMMADSQAAQNAVAAVQQTPAAVGILGKPVKMDGLVTGRLEDKDGATIIDLHIPVSGSKTSGSVEMAGTYTGVYNLKKFELTSGSQHIPLQMVHN
jgi:hypothetical protein